MNICSAIVHAKPENAGAVKISLEAVDGVEVHGGVEEGKLVVTLEGETNDALADTMTGFNQIDGVVNTIMVYHYCGEEPAEEEVIRETQQA